MRLVSSVEGVVRHFGVDPVAQFLFTTIRRDSHRVTRPIGLLDGDRSALLVRHQELGNAYTAGLAADAVVPYEPYVTFDERLLHSVRSAESLAAAVAERAGARMVGGDGTLPRQHLLALRAAGVAVEISDAEIGPVDVVEVRTSEVLGQMVAWRRYAAETVAPIVDAVPQLEGLSREFTVDVDTRFEDLAARLKGAGAEAALVSAPPNFSELTSLAERRGCWALWPCEGDRVFVISQADVFDTPGVVVARYASLGAAVVSLLGSPAPRIAVEDEWVTSGEMMSLEDAGVELVDFSRQLGSWRDVRDREDLPFQVLATRVSRSCIEGAIAWAHERLDQGERVTERQVHLRHLDLIHDFRREHRIPFLIEPYMVNAHSSRRVLYPCLPADFELDPREECMMLDSGVKVGIGGVVMGTSDMGRTLVRGERFEAAYALIRTIVTERFMPFIRPNTAMEEVHRYAMRAIEDSRGDLEALGMVDPGVDVEQAYRRRNVGHLMGKQESFANEFRPGSQHLLRVGDLGAAEMPWIYGDVALTHEDMWFIGRDRVYVTSV